MQRQPFAEGKSCMAGVQWKGEYNYGDQKSDSRGF